MEKFTMTPTEEFKHAIANGLSILERERKGIIRTAAFQPLQDQLHLSARRGLRKQAATLTEVDVDVMEDLMRLLKKVGKGTANGKEDFETRLGLALRLLDKLKPAPDSADMLVWNLNEIYKKVDWIVAQEKKRQLKEKGGVV
ncbi:MAG: hypothetical protein HY717_04215 [Planctomycetes bacterium]|nr:hypothetical protein [Planctomycetota bacterium]